MKKYANYTIKKGKRKIITGGSTGESWAPIQCLKVPLTGIRLTDIKFSKAVAYYFVFCNKTLQESYWKVCRFKFLCLI